MLVPPKGIISYAVTPFSQYDNQVDLKAFEHVIKHLLSTYSSAIALMGSTGESAYLTEDEWCSLASHGIAHTAKRIPVIIGIGEITTAAAIRKSQYAEQMGADALMIIPVSYWKLTDNEIFDYFVAIAEKTSLPIMAYNNPATSGLDMSPTLLLKMIREIDNVTMIKESSGDIQRMYTLFLETNGEIPFYNGSNVLALAALTAGAIGWCTAAPNLIDTQPAELFEAVNKGNLGKARELFYSMLPLLRFMSVRGLPSAVKAGLALRGLDAGVPRHPLQSLTVETLEELRQIMGS